MEAPFTDAAALKELVQKAYAGDMDLFFKLCASRVVCEEREGASAPLPSFNAEKVAPPLPPHPAHGFNSCTSSPPPHPTPDAQGAVGTWRA
jgi:hypothetical protein